MAKTIVLLYLEILFIILFDMLFSLELIASSHFSVCKMRIMTNMSLEVTF
jgi:hypothetical protein